MLKAFIRARTGFDPFIEKSYRAILSEALTALSVNVEDWSGDAITPSDDEEMLLLAHVIDIDKSEEEVERTAARQGVMVVEFSGSFVGKKEDETERSILIMGWDDLRQALQQARSVTGLRGALGHVTPVLDTIRRAVGGLNKRSVLDALAILSWCAVHEFDGEILRQEQKKWRSRDKWLQVFQGVTRKEFLSACGVPSESDLPATLGCFLDWMWPNNEEGQGPGEPPEFGEALNELETLFGMRCRL